jgi:DNA-binding transcriptional MerR regulator
MTMTPFTDKMNIPDKLTYKRNEVIKITRLDGKVIDYWQMEFGGFTPTVNQLGETFYTRNDIESILKIKNWMIEEKIEKSKVKKMLGETQKIETPSYVHPEIVSEEKMKQIPVEKLKKIRKGLQDILTILDKNDKNDSNK